MKYLVIENHESHSIVIDEAGAFYRIANLGYEIGESVTDPVFMKPPQKRQSKLNWKKLSTIAAIFICFLMAGVPFFNNYSQTDMTVYMNINPEIHLELNKNGKINRIVADNNDGKTLLDGYKYKGKNVSNVLIELIDRAAEMDFLTEGGNIQITVTAEKTDNAKTVSLDLSEILNDKYVKKYLIKIRVNDEEFLDIDKFVSTKETNMMSETESVTEEERISTNGGKSYYYTDGTKCTSVPVVVTESASKDYIKESRSVETSQSPGSTNINNVINTTNTSNETNTTNVTNAATESTIDAGETTEAGTTIVKPTEQMTESETASVEPAVSETLPTNQTDSSETVPVNPTEIETTIETTTEAASTESQATQETTQSVPTEIPSSESSSGSTEPDDEYEGPLWPWWPWWPWLP